MKRFVLIVQPLQFHDSVSGSKQAITQSAFRPGQYQRQHDKYAAMCGSLTLLLWKALNAEATNFPEHDRSTTSRQFAFLLSALACLLKSCRGSPASRPSTYRKRSSPEFERTRYLANRSSTSALTKCPVKQFGCFR